MKFISFLVLIFSFATSFAQKQTEVVIYFDLDQYTIRPSESARLDSLATVISKSPSGTTLTIYGHCDVRGSEEYNLTLSINRFNAVKKYLVEKGLDPSSIIKEEGFGKMQPVVDARIESMHALNRRVEIMINLPEEKPVPPPPPVVVVPPPPPVTTITKVIEDTATKVGSLITLRNLNFYGGRHILLRTSEPVLQELLTVMKNNPTLVISIEGHVCCIPGNGDGTDFDTNLANLSEARAKVVYDYLLNNGITADRITHRGYGHQRPLFAYPETTDVEQSLNRRVEIRIISK